MTAPHQPLRQRVIALAEKRNDTCAAFLVCVARAAMKYLEETGPDHG